MKPLTSEGETGSRVECSKRKDGECVSLPCIETKSKCGHGKRLTGLKKLTFSCSPALKCYAEDDGESRELVRGKDKHRGRAINVLMCWADAAVFALFSSWDFRMWFWASLHQRYMHQQINTSSSNKLANETTNICVSSSANCAAENTFTDVSCTATHFGRLEDNAIHFHAELCIA